MACLHATPDPFADHGSVQVVISGTHLTENQIVGLIRFEVSRYSAVQALWILAGDNSYQGKDGDRWKPIGRRVFIVGNGKSPALVTIHPTGENWPWERWENEPWLTVLGSTNAATAMATEP